MPLLIVLNSGLAVLYQCITLIGAKVDNHDFTVVKRSGELVSYFEYKKRKSGRFR